MSAEVQEVRDPLHGAIVVERRELPILDHPLFQRLRFIKQLGLSDLSFPGATHNRYLHSMGAMHLAGRAFDSIFGSRWAPTLPPERLAEMRRALRAAALLHDVGHAPFSHASEFAMPRVGDLDVPVHRGNADLYPPDRQATHEDYTIKIITDSSLSPVLRACGVEPVAVAGLIDPDLPLAGGHFEAGGVDWRPLLQQVISSELDVDRMDYLARDSHFSGVQYGVFDVGWLMNNLAFHVVDDRAYLALSDRAIYTFDDFLIARYHMFLMVYFHYRSVAYEEMLKQYFEEGGDGYAIPAEIEAYAGIDDMHLTTHLRRSDNPWARRIIERREFKLLLERHGERPRDAELGPVLKRLREAGIPTLRVESRGVLSKYFSKRQGPLVEGQHKLPLGGVPVEGPVPKTPPIYVLSEPYRGAAERRAEVLENSTDLFNRYSRHLVMTRVYVDPPDVAAAGALIADLV